MHEKIIDRMSVLLGRMDQLRQSYLSEDETANQLEDIICEFEELWPFWRQAAEQAGVTHNLLQEVESGMSQVVSHLPPMHTTQALH